MEKPVLSLLIPVYNTSKYLDACMKSVMAQDLKDMEIIFVDDGSTDNSPEMLQKYAENDPRIKIIRHIENSGLLKARRTGVENAAGEFIMFLDSDDTIDPGLCNAAVESIKEHKADILQFPARQISLENRKNIVVYPPSESSLGEDILRNIYVSRKISTSLVMKIYRSSLCKKAFSDIPDFNCYVGEDVLTSFYLGYYAQSFIGKNTQPKYNYYLGYGVSSEMIMPLEKYQKYCEMNRFYPMIRDFLQQNNASDAAYEALDCMTRRLITDCGDFYLRVPDEQKNEAWSMFWSHWQEIPNFSESVMYIFDKQEKTIDEIKNSESYRIGNAVINPVKAIKSRLSR